MSKIKYVKPPRVRINFGTYTPKVGDYLLTYNNSRKQLKVIKVYKMTWWRQILTDMGFRTRAGSCLLEEVIK